MVALGEDLNESQDPFGGSTVCDSVPGDLLSVAGPDDLCRHIGDAHTCRENTHKHQTNNPSTASSKARYRDKDSIFLPRGEQTTDPSSLSG